MTCTIHVETGLCKGCGICVDNCPPRVLAMSRDVGPRGYHYPVLEGACRGCRLCEQFCPDFAIVVECGGEA